MLLSTMRTLFTRRGLLAAGALALAILAGAAAPATARTLDEIKQSGKIVVGIQGGAAPWGFIDASGQHVGYDVDVANKFAEELGVDLEVVLVTGSNRTAQLLSGKVDILIASVGMYPDRAKAVQFTKPYLMVNIGAVARESVDVTTPADLLNYRVGAARSSAQANAMMQAEPALQIQYFDDDASSIQALLSNQIDVVGGNNTYPRVIQPMAPNETFEMKLVLNSQPTGMAVEPGNKSLLDFANGFIDKLTADGTLNTFYQTWLGEELPAFPTEVEGVPFYIE